MTHRCRLALTAVISSAACLGVLAPAAASAAPACTTPHRVTSVAYVEVNNDQLANVGRYSLADGSRAFDVAIIFAANINFDGTKAVLYSNDNVQKTLDDAATQIRPLQARGIKVELSILGNHAGVGISNFTSKAAAQDFADQVRDEVRRYKLDGVDLDDEYADYGTNGQPPTNVNSARWLVSALRADLPNKTISFYNIGPAADSLHTASPAVGSKLTYAFNPYYDSYSPPSIPGLTKAHLSPAAIDIQSTPAADATSLARRTVSEKYGVFMTYNLPDGNDSAYVSAFTKPLYGQSATYH